MGMVVLLHARLKQECTVVVAVQQPLTIVVSLVVMVEMQAITHVMMEIQ